MIIAKTNVAQATSHYKDQSTTETESLTVQRFGRDGEINSEKVKPGDVTSLSEEALRLANDLGNMTIEQRSSEVQMGRRLVADGSSFIPLTDQGANGPVADQSARAVPRDFTIIDRLLAPKMPPPPPTTDAVLSLNAAIIASISGESIELSDGRALQDRFSSLEQIQIGPQHAIDFELNLNEFQPPEEGTIASVRYERHELYSEVERTSYEAKGEIQTADGKTINVDLMMEMSHHYATSRTTEINGGVRLMDPLVINFGGSAADLTTEKMGFDLNADGQQEQISFATEGSGFLMLDKNGDGKANNGSELFGALSGNGFADLTEYDDDGNGFIDEGDAIYSELKIWVRNGSGEDEYFSLEDKDIGAIYLGAVRTPFEIKDDNNALQGVVRSSSFFLREDGSSGTVQQLDLVV